MIQKQFREKIQYHLVKGEIEEALKLLISGLDRNQQRREHDNALMLKATWERLKQEQLRGVISRQEYDIAISKVVVGIQTIMNDMDDVVEIPKIQNYAPNIPFNKIVIMVGILCVIGFSAWYIVTKNIAIPIVQGNTTAPTTELPNDKTVKVIQKGVATEGKINREKEKASQNTIVEKPTVLSHPTLTKQPDIAAPIKPEPNPDNAQVTELKSVPVTLVLNGDNTKLKIDDKNISGSGILKVNLTIGEHKFEIFEGNESCIRHREIEKTTKSINLTCN